MPDFLLKEDGFDLLLESGDKIILDEPFVEEVSTFGAIMDAYYEGSETFAAFASFISPFQYISLGGIAELEATRFKPVAAFSVLELLNVRKTFGAFAELQHFQVRTFGAFASLMPQAVRTFSAIADLIGRFNDVTYNGYSINSTAIITETAVHDSAPKRNTIIYPSARSDGEKLVAAYFSNKEIVVTGFLQRNSQINLESLIDNFKAQFQRSYGNLDIGYGGMIRRYKVNFSDLTITRNSDNVDWAPFKITFVAPSGFGQDVITSDAGFSGITSLSYSNVFHNVGTATARPIVTITVNSQSGLSAMSLQCGNTITITRSFVNGDVITIDFDQFVVKVNGSAVAYTGAFPSWDAGNNNFTLSSTASSVNINIDFNYYANYL